jgi:hypothetical protein
VLVVAHSQGTLIAAEALELLADRRALAPSALATFCPRELKLVTMGSPIGHLYGHYFPRLYRLKPAVTLHVNHWLNIYRRDDFIGTAIGSAASTFPENLPIPPRGHTDYWRDRDALQAIAHLI